MSEISRNSNGSMTDVVDSELLGLNLFLIFFKERIARFRPLVTFVDETDSMETVRSGTVPKLSSLNLHNGTLWTWNRICYGTCNGVAHLRIENRSLPSGPSVIDEVANAAFFYGMVVGLTPIASEIPSRLPFDDAKKNFLAAAQDGLEAGFTWLDGRKVSVQTLILEDLLPVARQGLASIGVSEDHISRYLGIVEQRVRTKRTGSHWILRSMDLHAKAFQRQQHGPPLTAEMVRHQRTGAPVHEWEIANGNLEQHFIINVTAVDVMSADLITVRACDVVDLASSLMRWMNLRHVPVEDASGEAVGCICLHSLLKTCGEELGKGNKMSSVGDLMCSDVPTVLKSAPLAEVIEKIESHHMGCVLVTDECKQLLGIVTEKDIVRCAGKMLKAISDKCTDE
eukprot:Rmarinus@m.11149